MKAIDLKLNASLPEDMRRESFDLTKRGVGELMAEIATKHPDDYSDLIHKIGTIGRNAAYAQGNTVTRQDFRPVIDLQRVYKLMDIEVKNIDKRGKSDRQIQQEKGRIYTKYSDIIEKDTMTAALASGNSIAKAVASGARGKGAHLKALISTPGVYTDSKDNVIPLFVRNSFAQGVRPAESLAGTYGARKGVTSTKRATAKGGELAKLLAAQGANYNITEKDCGTTAGIPLSPDDKSIRGRVLAMDAQGYDTGSVVDRKAMATFRKKGKNVVVRSPMTCQSPNGICSACAGMQAGGQFAKIGDSVGITGGQAIAEPITQGALNCLAEGTEVRMADSTTKKIEDVRPGDIVMGSDINGRLFPVKVTHHWDQGIQPVEKYTYRPGQTKQELHVTCTKDHPILSNTKKSSCKEEVLNHTLRKLPAGYKCNNIAAVLSSGHTGDGFDFQDDLAFIHGLLMGDGIRRDEGDLRFSCADDVLIDDLRLSYPALTFKKRTRSFDWAILAYEKRNPVKEAEDNFGLHGLYCHEKFVPKQVFSSWSNESVAKLIAGYTAADGSVGLTKSGHAFVSYGSTSKQLLEDVKLLLSTRFGVHSSALTKAGKAGVGNRKNDLWMFSITQLPQVKRMEVIFDHMLGVKRHTYDTVISKAKPSHMDEFYRAKRKRVEPQGNQQCYDISVDHEDELFVLANGIICKNTKHTGGAASGKREYSGFDVISRFMQIPEAFKDKAVVSKIDGTVTSVEEAPQGGHYVTVNNERHYTPQGFDTTVKVGDNVEAGDQMSDGLVNPAEVVKYKGLGAGRKYYADRLAEILEASDQPTDRFNVEMLAKANVSHIRAIDPDRDDEALPDDLVADNKFFARYKPPKNTTTVSPFRALGTYLQKPVLHYTPGTRITPKVRADMEEYGIKEIDTSPDEPWFKPEMQRLTSASHGNDDWMAAMQTSYLKKQLVESAIRGKDTDTKNNTHFAPRLAVGDDFGRNTETTGMF